MPAKRGNAMADYTLSAKVTAEISGFQKNMKSALSSFDKRFLE